MADVRELLGENSFLFNVAILSPDTASNKAAASIRPLISVQKAPPKPAVGAYTECHCRIRRL